jgi:hypothetical protein
VPHTLTSLTPARLASAAFVLLVALAAMLLVGSPAGAQTDRAALSARVAAHPSHGRRHRRSPRLGNQGRARLARNSVVPTRKVVPTRNPAAPILEAGFEHNFANWNTAGLGEAMPTIDTSDARSGTKSGDFRLTGTEERSELSLGGNGSESDSGLVHFTEGDEYWYGFSFNIQQMVWGHPGAHNLIMQFKSEGEGSPEFGLQLWNYAGDGGHGGGKGLWSHSNPSSDAPGGDRFLAPVSEDEWYDVAIHFKASSQGEGFYEIFLDGQLVESRSDVTMIVPGASFAYIKDGIYRNGDAIPGTSEILLDDSKLGTSDTSVQPG